MSVRITDISTIAELEEVLETSFSQPVVLFKHSNSCGLSTRAQRQIDRLSDGSDPLVYRIVVQRARDVSDYVESRFEVRHESPQVFVLENGTPVFNASHHRVTADSIRAAVAESSTR
jgi:bacillithiol system protein YtxJ